MGDAGTSPAIPWRSADWAARGVVATHALDAPRKMAHGRHERREAWTLADPDILATLGANGVADAPWPGVAQIVLVRRTRTIGTCTVRRDLFFVTSIPPERANARRMLALIRGHWSIENQLHWVRDVTFDEDRSQIRTGYAPRVMATCRNLVTTLIRQSPYPHIASALRTYAGRPRAAATLVLGKRR